MERYAPIVQDLSLQYRGTCNADEVLAESAVAVPTRLRAAGHIYPGAALPHLRQRKLPDITEFARTLPGDGTATSPIPVFPTALPQWAVSPPTTRPVYHSSRRPSPASTQLVRRCVSVHDANRLAQLAFGHQRVFGKRAGRKAAGTCNIPPRFIQFGDTAIAFSNMLNGILEGKGAPGRSALSAQTCRKLWKLTCRCSHYRQGQHRALTAAIAELEEGLYRTSPSRTKFKRFSYSTCSRLVSSAS